jgi:hypothetical protein
VAISYQLIALLAFSTLKPSAFAFSGQPGRAVILADG